MNIETKYLEQSVELHYDNFIKANISLRDFEVDTAFSGVLEPSRQWSGLAPFNPKKPTRILNLFRRFQLLRLTDKTGVSGTGTVASGVIFECGKVTLCWRHPHETIGVYDSFEQFLTIHVYCHPDSNRVKFLD